MIPAMLTGTFIYNRRYSPLEYFFVLLITAGVAMFAYKPGIAASTTNFAPNLVLLGYAMCFFNLFADGYTNTT